LDRRLSGPQSRSGRGGEEKDSQPLLGIELRRLQLKWHWNGLVFWTLSFVLY